MAEPKISVIIPAYKAADTIGRAVDSVLAQGVPAQIIIVDDGSPDDTAVAVEALRARCGESFVFFRQSNCGSAGARNSGIRFALCPYVCFLDADDEYAEGYFARVLSYLDANPDVAAISTGMEFVNLNRPVHPLQYERILASSPTNTMIRREVAELLFGFPQDHAFRGRAGSEDTFYKMALVNNFNVVAIPDKFYRYNIEPGNHLHYFLDRSRVENGQIVFSEHTREEASGQIGGAAVTYLDEVKKRLAIAFASKASLDLRLGLVFEAIEDFAANAHEALTTPLGPTEAAPFALYHLAKIGPASGIVVEVADAPAACTQALAAGTRAAQREGVLCLSLQAADDTAPATVEIRQARLGVGEGEDIRLLVITADQSFETLAALVQPLLGRLRPTALVALVNGAGASGMDVLHSRLMETGRWRAMAACADVRLIARA